MSEITKTPLTILIDFLLEKKNVNIDEIIVKASELKYNEEKELIIETIERGLVHGKQGGTTTGEGYFKRNYSSMFCVKSGNKELERFKSYTKAIEICEYYKEKGFENAFVSQTV